MKRDEFFSLKSYILCKMLLAQLKKKERSPMCLSIPIQRVSTLIKTPVQKLLISAIDSGGSGGARASPEFGGSEKG